MGVRRADIGVRRVNVTPPKMDISQPRMNITPRRMNTMPDYKAPEVVTPRQPDRDARGGRSGQGGIRAASPNRLVSPSGDGEGRGSRSGDSTVRDDGRGDGRNDDRSGGRGDGRGDWNRNERGDPSNGVDRLREQRDRNTRDAGRDSGREGGRGDGRGDWNGRRDDDRRDDDRGDHDRDRGDWRDRDRHDDRDWDRDGHDRYSDRYRGYLVTRPRDYYIHDRPVYRYTGSGLYIRGGYLGDRWSVDARLSSGVYGLDCYRPGYFCPSSTWLTCDRGWVGGHWNGYYWSSFDWPYGYPSSYWVQRGQFTDFTSAVPASEAVVVERDVRMEEMQTPTAPLQVPIDDSGMLTSQSLSAVGTSSLDDGLSALMQGDSQRGADELRVHLREHRDDGRALRLLAVALEESGEPVDAAAVMRMAHEMDPALATESLGLEALGYSDARLRDMVDNAVIHAHRVKGQHSTEAASAWLTVAVLMREQGRDDLAREMIVRAKRAGLRADVADSIELAWR